MGFQHVLKYLPIPIMFSRETTKNSRQFIIEIPNEEISDPVKIAYYARRLKLLVQQTYRKEIRHSGKLMEDYYLSLVTEVTIVKDTPINFIYCITGLELVDEIDG